MKGWQSSTLCQGLHFTQGDEKGEYRSETEKRRPRKFGPDEQVTIFENFFCPSSLAQGLNKLERLFLDRFFSVRQAGRSFTVLPVTGTNALAYPVILLAISICNIEIFSFHKRQVQKFKILKLSKWNRNSAVIF